MTVLKQNGSIHFFYFSFLEKETNTSSFGYLHTLCHYLETFHLILFHFITYFHAFCDYHALNHMANRRRLLKENYTITSFKT